MFGSGLKHPGSTTHLLHPSWPVFPIQRPLKLADRNFVQSKTAKISVPLIFFVLSPLNLADR
jgi:hypothetical protein